MRNQYQKVLTDILSSTYSELEAHILDNRHSIFKRRLMQLYYLYYQNDKQ